MLSKDNANKLRKNQTPEEELLWKRLKNRRLAEFKFRRQAVIDSLIVDFCCFEKKLVIELDGSQHISNRPADFARDNYLKSQGFKILRIWNGEIKKDIEKVLDKIIKELESPSSGAIAPPSPVKGEGKVDVLIIIAHPDDESFLFAGTTMKFEDEGKTVGIICATRGERGADRLNRNLSMEQMAKIREQELYSACHILNCTCNEFFGYPDGRLEKLNFDRLVKILTTRINEYQPKIILTFGKEGISGHRDHIIVGKAAVEASKQANPKPKEVWQASIPASRAKDFRKHIEQRKVHRLHFVKNLLKGIPDKKLVKINVRNYKEKKLEAIKAHKSQYLPNLVWEGFLEQECFEIIKP
jgi:very-short-patch-repair endonuclease/LmbE family N-acetylglucosaminyl deacetylase